MVGKEETLEETLNAEMEWLSNSVGAMESILDEHYPAVLRDQDFKKVVEDAKGCIVRMQMALRGVTSRKL